jgi:drug/metabolite transporter (DMT)-like permease
MGAAAGRRRFAESMLLLVTVFWGVSFAAIKSATLYVSPALFVGLRFTFAALILIAMWPVLSRRFGADGDDARAGGLFAPASLRWGWLLGLLIAIGYTTQTVGLGSTTANNSAFITALSVVLVPVLLFLFHRTRPSRPVGAGILLAVLGLALLTRPDLGRAAPGDLWTLGTALAYALYLERLSAALKKVHFLPLLFWTVIVCAVLNLAWALLVEDRRLEWNRVVVVGFVVTTLFSTLGALWLQNRYQGETTATRAALIFSAEPVFAAAFSWAWLGERLRGWSLAGALVILGAVLLIEVIGTGDGAGEGETT